MDLDDDSGGGGCGGSAKLSSQLRTLIDADGRLMDEAVACRTGQPTPSHCAANLYANCFHV